VLTPGCCRGQADARPHALVLPARVEHRQAETPQAVLDGQLRQSVYQTAAGSFPARASHVQSMGTPDRLPMS